MTQLTLVYFKNLYKELACLNNLLVFLPTFFQTAQTELLLTLVLLITMQSRMELTRVKQSLHFSGEFIMIHLSQKYHYNYRGIPCKYLGSLALSHLSLSDYNARYQYSPIWMTLF